MGHSFITSKSVSGKPAWALAYLGPSGWLLPWQTQASLWTRHPSDPGSRIEGCRGGGQEGHERQRPGAQPGTQYSGPLTYFYTISSYYLSIFFFFSRTSLWSLENVMSLGFLGSPMSVSYLFVQFTYWIGESSFSSANFTLPGIRTPSLYSHEMSFH